MIKLFRIFLIGFCFHAAAVHAGENTPLHDAAGNGDKAKVEALLAQGMDVNTKDKSYGLTPLHLAKNKDIAELLLSKGADVKAKDDGGQTPLHWAARGWHKDVVELLLSKGADVNAKGNLGTTPLHSAAIAGKKDIAELLLARLMGILHYNWSG